ncbi:MAG: hypothetical protein Q8S14_17930 [Algoriphagus sp.]|uniref:hypothetical protein n=1 Tax=Algoriphagus sp. TaxID=1872435 RepID=UPI00272F1268|nr:hypothetical protein [Algoriphagus sp.]MDP2042813.1 hypothetical protein [Algoriphagus sp.]MDP3473756.1 hypothetical protein [Algoriphagus sp.]
MKTSLQTYQPISYPRMISRRGNCGLRPVALLNLKIEDTSTSLSADIESKRVMLGINKGKGAKDWEILISEKMIKLLQEHYRYEKPKVSLFEEQMLEEKYNERSLQQALKKPRIKKPINLHWLQHSHCDTPLGGWDRSPLHTGIPWSQIQQNNRNQYIPQSEKPSKNQESI